MGFKRSEWNTIIQQINDKITACGSSIEPLVEAGPDHRWSVDDVRTVQTTLMGLCTNADFDPVIPLRWKQSTINRLQEAIVACDCCGWEMYELPYTWGLTHEACTILGAPYDCYYLNLAGQTCGASGFRYRVGALYCDVLYRINGDLAPRKIAWGYTILDDSGIAASEIPNTNIFAVETGSTIIVEELDSSLHIGSVNELATHGLSLPDEIEACLVSPFVSSYYGIEIRRDVVCL